MVAEYSRRRLYKGASLPCGSEPAEHVSQNSLRQIGTVHDGECLHGQPPGVPGGRYFGECCSCQCQLPWQSSSQSAGVFCQQKSAGKMLHGDRATSVIPKYLSSARLEYQAASRHETWGSQAGKVAMPSHSISRHFRSLYSVADCQQLTAWPRLKGLMSRKAIVFSVSMSLKQGISPERYVILAAAATVDNMRRT